MTGKGDDNMTYEQPAKKSIFVAIHYMYTSKDAPLEAHDTVVIHVTHLDIHVREELLQPQGNHR